MRDWHLKGNYQGIFANTGTTILFRSMVLNRPRIQDYSNGWCTHAQSGCGHDRKTRVVTSDREWLLHVSKVTQYEVKVNGEYEAGPHYYIKY